MASWERRVRESVCEGGIGKRESEGRLLVELRRGLTGGAAEVTWHKVSTRATCTHSRWWTVRPRGADYPQVQKQQGLLSHLFNLGLD